MSIVTLPTPHVNVNITYKKTFYSGPYGEKKDVRTVTRLGFYSDQGDYWLVPDDWQYFRIGGSLCYLPHGWNRDKLTTDQVISWTPSDKQ